MQLGLAVAILCAMLAPTAANAQLRETPMIPKPYAEPRPHGINFRLTQTIPTDLLAPSSRGIMADTEVAPNARVGMGLITLSRPMFGPEWRTDGRTIRSRKPALTFTFRF